jgi:hypothetical protein
MSVHVEVWPVAADEARIWLLSGEDAWRTGPVMSDDEPHSDVEGALTQHGAEDKVSLLHSTSWRPDGPHIILTYVAVIKISAFARDTWPKALPITLGLVNNAGKPLPGSPTEAPTPRHIDVLMHGLRHLRFLLDTDTTNAAALDDHWRHHLAGLEPALAGLYLEKEGP